MEKTDLQNLKKRYLVWLYKTTKTAFDKIERKFSQLEIDRSLLAEIKKLDKKHQLKSLIDEFKAYILNKEKEGLSLKFEDKGIKPSYLFLEFKLKAIEKIIIQEFGRLALKDIKEAYEREMTGRILAEREEKV